MLHLDAMTVTGQTLGEALDAQPRPFAQDIVRQFIDPLFPGAALVVLRGNLAPDGAVLKASAMAAHLRAHKGRACVFRNADDMLERIDDPDLDVTADSM